MLSDQRKIEIEKFICREGKANIAELAAYFQVSGETIRRDLSSIADGKTIRKVHGGAIAIRQQVRDGSYSERQVHNVHLKQRIGEYAVRFLADNDTIAIDSGTTSECFAQAIYNIRNLKIITNTIPIASILTRKLAAGHFTGSVILLGGTVDPERQTICGPTIISQMKNYHVDKAFIAVTAVSDAGIMSWKEEDGFFTSTLIQQSDRRYVLAESEKFNKKSFYFISPFQGLTALITDTENKIDEITQKSIVSSGTMLHLADLRNEGEKG